MTTIPVKINGTFAAYMKLTDTRKYDGIGFVPGNTLTPEQIGEIQTHFNQTYVNSYIGSTEESYETTV
jgi:hypothetical protein